MSLIGDVKGIKGNLIRMETCRCLTDHQIASQSGHGTSIISRSIVEKPFDEVCIKWRKWSEIDIVIGLAFGCCALIHLLALI